jgi:hypothetical protein
MFGNFLKMIKVDRKWSELRQIVGKNIILILVFLVLLCELHTTNLE